MKYRIGQKVVYIGDDFSWHPLVRGRGLTVPVPQAIYTIRGGRDGAHCLGYPIYLLEEIINPILPCSNCGEPTELHIGETLLRPLIARKNDGEAFVAGLRPLLREETWRVKLSDKVKSIISDLNRNET